MPRLHFVTLGIGCLFPSVASRFRLRLRGTLPHPRILFSFSRVLSTRPGRRIRKHHISSFPATTKRLRQQLAAGESDWSLSALSVFFQVRPAPLQPPEPRAPGTQKPREKLLTFKRHTADFHTTKHEPLRFGIPLNTHSANKNIVAQTSTVVLDTTVQMSCVTKGNRQGTRPSTPSQKTLCPTEVGFQTP